MTKICDKYCEIVNNSIFKQHMAKYSKLTMIWTSFDLVGETTISWKCKACKEDWEEYLDFVLETAHLCSLIQGSVISRVLIPFARLRLG